MRRDVEEVIALLDLAIQSDDPRVQKEFDKFLFKLSLIEVPEDRAPGLIQDMIDERDYLRRKCAMLEADQLRRRYPEVQDQWQQWRTWTSSGTAPGSFIPPNPIPPVTLTDVKYPFKFDVDSDK